MAVKWYLPEELRDEALKLSARMGAGGVELLAPSTIGPEVFNALRQQRQRGNLSLEEVREYSSSFREAPISVFETDSLVARASEVSLETGVIIYDALFLALAEETNTIMVTADGKLSRTLKGTPYAHLVHDPANLGAIIK